MSGLNLNHISAGVTEMFSFILISIIFNIPPPFPLLLSTLTVIAGIIYTKNPDEAPLALAFEAFSLVGGCWWIISMLWTSVAYSFLFLGFGTLLGLAFLIDIENERRPVGALGGLLTFVLSWLPFFLVLILLSKVNAEVSVYLFLSVLPLFSLTHYLAIPNKVLSRDVVWLQLLSLPAYPLLGEYQSFLLLLQFLTIIVASQWRRIESFLFRNITSPGEYVMLKWKYVHTLFLLFFGLQRDYYFTNALFYVLLALVSLCFGIIVKAYYSPKWILGFLNSLGIGMVFVTSIYWNVPSCVWYLMPVLFITSFMDIISCGIILAGIVVEESIVFTILWLLGVSVRLLPLRWKIRVHLPESPVMSVSRPAVLIGIYKDNSIAIVFRDWAIKRYRGKLVKLHKVGTQYIIEDAKWKAITPFIKEVQEIQ
ncbi:MAG: hypothetical protein QXL15_04675, partial [Candidatus Korarchaeota archaeon]